jgi:hypothetical protein
MAFVALVVLALVLVVTLGVAPGIVSRGGRVMADVPPVTR